MLYVIEGVQFHAFTSICSFRKYVVVQFLNKEYDVVASNWMSVDLTGSKQMICWYPNEPYVRLRSIWARARRPVTDFMFTPFEVEVFYPTGE